MAASAERSRPFTIDVRDEDFIGGRDVSGLCGDGSIRRRHPLELKSERAWRHTQGLFDSRWNRVYADTAAWKYQYCAWVGGEGPGGPPAFEYRAEPILRLAVIYSAGNPQRTTLDSTESLGLPPSGQCGLFLRDDTRRIHQFSPCRSKRLEQSVEACHSSGFAPLRRTNGDPQFHERGDRREVVFTNVFQPRKLAVAVRWQVHTSLLGARKGPASGVAGEGEAF